MQLLDVVMDDRPQSAISVVLKRPSQRWKSRRALIANQERKQRRWIVGEHRRNYKIMKKGLELEVFRNSIARGTVSEVINYFLWYSFYVIPRFADKLVADK